MSSAPLEIDSPVAVSVSTIPSAVPSSQPGGIETTMVETGPAPSVPVAPAPAVAAPVPTPIPGVGVAVPVAAGAPAARRVSTASASSTYDGAQQAPAPKSPAKSKKKKNQPTVTMATAATAQSNGQGTNGENTGRWTAEEHRLFLQGLEQHGKGWKKIASLIKSRTVVQIRTHAQKYFQKLAKARQNGEEGDVTMEGRGGVGAVGPSTASAAQNNKRRRQTTGTKRKAIQSVVVSAQRQGKKMAIAQAVVGSPHPEPPLPAVAPALANFVLPTAGHVSNEGGLNAGGLPSITTSQGTISGPALEDSLFRFLTPAPVAPEPQVNDVARQAGANPITLPSDNPSPAPSALAGEVSPTSVADLALYPSWTDAKDAPSWYAKGGDVDALLDVADTLDWLTDTGDLHETYQPPANAPKPDTASEIADVSPNMENLPEPTPVNNAVDLDTIHQETSADSVVPPLPALFEEGDDVDAQKQDHSIDLSLPQPTSTDDMEDHLDEFDEHDFVATLLENNGDSSESLSALS